MKATQFITSSGQLRVYLNASYLNENDQKVYAREGVFGYPIWESKTGDYNEKSEINDIYYDKAIKEFEADAGLARGYKWVDVLAHSQPPRYKVL